MSRDGGRAATLAAVSGAGNGGLRDRFPTPALQQERLSQLEAQLRFYVKRSDAESADGVRAQIREMEQLRRAGAHGGP
jgi:protein-arginine kinase activator protein McsA